MTRSGLAPRPCGHPRQSPGRDCTPLSTLRRPTHPPARVQRLIVLHDTISMGHEGICATQSGIDVHLGRLPGGLAGRWKGPALRGAAFPCLPGNPDSRLALNASVTILTLNTS